MMSNLARFASVANKSNVLTLTPLEEWVLWATMNYSNYIVAIRVLQHNLMEWEKFSAINNAADVNASQQSGKP